MRKVLTDAAAYPSPEGSKDARERIEELCAAVKASNTNLPGPFAQPRG